MAKAAGLDGGSMRPSSAVQRDSAHQQQHAASHSLQRVRGAGTSRNACTPTVALEAPYRLAGCSALARLLLDGHLCRLSIAVPSRTASRAWALS